MENQVTNNANALRLFFTEDVFLVEDENVKMPPVISVKPISDPNIKLENLAQETVSEQETEGNSVVKPVESVKNYIPEAEITHIVAEPTASKMFRFLGGNKKSVLILVNDQLNDVSTEQGRELLRKIVKAVDLSTPDFAVLNYAHYHGTDFIELHQFFKPAIMLSFGVEISDLKLNLTWQNEVIIHETTRMIFAPNLHHLDSDLTAKKLLWSNLQKIK